MKFFEGWKTNRKDNEKLKQNSKKMSAELLTSARGFAEAAESLRNLNHEEITQEVEDEMRTEIDKIRKEAEEIIEK